MNAGKSLHQGSRSRRRGRVPGDVDLSGYLAVSRRRPRARHVALPGRRGWTDPDRLLRKPGRAVSEHTARFVDRADLRLRPSRALGAARRAHLPRQQRERAEDAREPRRRRLRRQAGRSRSRSSPLRPSSTCRTLARRPAGALLLRVRCDNLLDAQRRRSSAISYPLDPAYTTVLLRVLPGATRSFLAGLDFAF